jgi:RND family efflux transporter MFP subunit
MGAVVTVEVREGDRVRSGDVLARIDAREVNAKRDQVNAGTAAAEATYQEASTHAARMRALYADSAATKAQLDAAETGLARAEAGVRASRAAQAELEAMGSYTVLRAPFNGLVTRRYLDPGAFAAPGTPIIEIQDGSRLRIAVDLAPEAARGLRRGQTLEATVEAQPTRAVIEGVIPAPAGALYTVNAVVDNRAGVFLPGSAATLLLPLEGRRVVLVPDNAVVTEGDLSGVRVVGAAGPELRWVRLGRRSGGWVEILAGLRAGEQISVAGAAEGP